MNSDFLNDVMSINWLEISRRVNNHAMCFMEVDGKGMDFLATDENGWYGVLMVQLQMELTENHVSHIQRLLRSLEPLPKSQYVDFECHDLTHQVRAVLRLSLHQDYSGIDDAKHAIRTLFDAWTAVEPLINRVLDHESIDSVIQDAKKHLSWTDQQPVPLMEILQKKIKSVDSLAILNRSSTLGFVLFDSVNHFQCELLEAPFGIEFRGSCEMEIPSDRLAEIVHLAELTRGRIEFARVSSRLAENIQRVTIRIPLNCSLWYLSTLELEPVLANLLEYVGFISKMLLDNMHSKCSVADIISTTEGVMNVFHQSLHDCTRFARRAG